jgi:hypothetical protein
LTEFSGIVVFPPTMTRRTAPGIISILSKQPGEGRAEQKVKMEIIYGILSKVVNVVYS